MTNIAEQNIDDPQEHLLVVIVEVDLVRAEGSPDVPLSMNRGVRGQKIGRSRPHHQFKMFVGYCFPGRKGDKEVFIFRVPMPELTKPAALCRNVIDDAIEHELITCSQIINFLPATDA